MSPTYTDYRHIWPDIDISVKSNLLKKKRKSVWSQEELRLLKCKLIKKVTYERSFKVFVTHLVEERKIWHLKADDHISEGLPVAIKMAKLLNYKPVF